MIIHAYHSSKVAELITVVKMYGCMKCSVAIINLAVVDNVRMSMQHYLHTTVCNIRIKKYY